MKLNSTQINSYVSSNRINTNNSDRKTISSDNESKIKEDYYKEDDILDIPDTSIPEINENNKILTGKEQAILHGLFGSSKPSEMSFYGSNELRHIHKGQLMDVSG